MKKSIIVLSVSVLSFLAAGFFVSAQQASAQVSTTGCYSFRTNLRIGDTNSNVANLIKVLIREGVYEVDEMYDASAAVQTFDEQVASAVVEFQEKYASSILTPNGLRRGTGYVGPATRVKLNALYGCMGSQPVQYPVVQQPFVCPTGYICRPTNQILDEIRDEVNESRSTYRALPVDSSISGQVTLVSANEDKVFKWANGPIHAPDWKWSVNIKNNGSSNKTIKRLVIVHNTSGEGWASDESANNPVRKSLYLLGTTLDLCTDCSLFNIYTPNLAYEVGAGSSRSFYAYGYPGSHSFTGGYLWIEFTDGTSAQISIPSSNIRPGSSTVVENQPIADPCPAGYSCTSPISVVIPKGGESYKFGDTMTVRWNTGNYNGSHVGLVLRRSDTHASAPSDSGDQAQLVPNTGSHTWTIGNIGEGGTYNLRIVCSPVSACIYAESKSFTIGAATIGSNKPPVISGASYPSALKLGQMGAWSVIAQDPEGGSLSYSIDWGDSSSLAKSVVQTSSFSHAYYSVGTYTVTITVTDSQGASTKTSSTVRVGTAAVPVEETSVQTTYPTKPIIATKPSSTNPRVTVLAPNGGESITHGEKVRITWSWSGFESVDPYVDVYLVPTDGRAAIKVGQGMTMANGSYGMVIPMIKTYMNGTPAPFQAGTYTVKVACSSTNPVGYQSCEDSSNSTFRIVEAPASTATPTPTPTPTVSPVVQF